MTSSRLGFESLNTLCNLKFTWLPPLNGRPQGRPFSYAFLLIARRVLGRPAPSLPVEHLFGYFLFDLFVKVAQKNILKFVHIYY